MEQSGRGNQEKYCEVCHDCRSCGAGIVGFRKTDTGIGNTISSVGKIAGAVKKLGSVFTLLTSPVGIAIVAITAIAAIALVVYKNWDKIVAVFNKVRTAISNFATSAGETLSGVAERITEFVQNAQETLANVLGGIIEGVKEKFTSFRDGVLEVIQAVQDKFQSIIDFLVGTFTEKWTSLWEGLKNIVSTAFGALADLVKVPINAVINVVNGAISRINGIKFTVPAWVPGLGGKGWQGLNIPTIPNLAKGTDDWQGGIVQVHEKGGEIIDLPEGSRVYPHDESVKMAKQDESRHISLTIAKLADQIIVREDADIDRIAEAIAEKLEKVQLNMV